MEKVTEATLHLEKVTEAMAKCNLSLEYLKVTEAMAKCNLSLNYSQKIFWSYWTITADENLRVLGIKDIFHTVGQCKRYLNGNYSICLCNDGNLCNKASMLDIISNESNSNIVKPNIFVFLIASFMFCILIQNYE